MCRSVTRPPSGPETVGGRVTFEAGFVCGGHRFVSLGVDRLRGEFERRCLVVAVVVGSHDGEVLDLDAVLPDDDGEAIGQLGASLGAIQAALLERVARFDGEERWMGMGATSMASWLVARLDVSYATASGWVKTARALQDLPTISKTLGEGGVSLDQVRALCWFATGDDEGEVLGWARDRAASELQAVARDHEGEAAVTVAGDNRLFEGREVSWWWSEDRCLRFKATVAA
jgi:hypothetical protein